MTLELSCRTCGPPFDAGRQDLLRGERCCPSCRDADDAPRVPAIAVWSERSKVWCLRVECCPSCGGRHHHGGNDGPDPDLGVRRSHCVTGGGGAYVLVESDASGTGRIRRRPPDAPKGRA